MFRKVQRRLLHLLLLLPLVACAAGTAVAATEIPDLVLRQGDVLARIDHGVELLIERDGEGLTTEQALSPAMSARWVVYPGRKINLSREARPVWIRFDLRQDGSAPKDWVLAIDWTLLKHVRLQQRDAASGQWGPVYTTGLSELPSPDVISDPAPAFPIALAPGQRSTVLLRVQTDSQFAAPLAVWDAAEFHARRNDHATLIGLLFGILGVMLFYNLSLYVFTRERSFLSYAVYLLSIVLYELSVTGYGAFYIWGGSTWWGERAYELTASCSFLAASVFFRHFLGLKSAAPHLNRINQVIVGFWVLVTVMAAFPPSLTLSLFVVFGGLAGSVAGVYTSAYLAIKGNVLARYFLIAWVSIIVATVVTLLFVMGAIEGGGMVDYAQHIGFVLETVLLSVALAERIKRETASKEAAQRESFDLTRKVEQEREAKIRAQERALEVQREANEELELRVIDRTAELKRAMENVELANIELAKLSLTDPLTKVHNRRYFDETLKKEHDRSARTGTPLALVLADIDHFKKINDSVGHLAGDECLKLVATTLAKTVGRSTDLVARYGGEEFAVVLPATDAAQAIALAERMRRAVEGIDFIYAGKRVPISISLGLVAEVANDERSVVDFIARADEALYAAKRGGRNQARLSGAG